MKKTLGLPKHFEISVSNLMVLYFNLYQAKNDPDIGFVDSDNSLGYIMRNIDDHKMTIKPHELESLLYACVLLAEKDSFWHPKHLKVDTFVSRVLHHQQLKFYFDKIYCLLRDKKPRINRLKGEIISNQYREQLELEKEEKTLEESLEGEECEHV
jgi:hypothetical protein